MFNKQAQKGQVWWVKEWAHTQAHGPRGQSRSGSRGFSMVYLAPWEGEGHLCELVLFPSLSRTIPSIVTCEITGQTFLTPVLKDCTMQPLLLKLV